MDIIYQQNQATVAEVQKIIPDDLNYSSVRALMNILADKGFLKHSKIGRAYVYKPVVTRKKASSQALKQVVNTFFEGSVESVVTTLISSNSKNLTDEEYQRLAELIESKRGRESSGD